jgi:hypothetical protein
VQLVRGNTIFAVGQQPRRREPFVESDRAVLKHGADFEGELLFGVLPIAAVDLSLFQPSDLLRLAAGAADYPIGPPNGYHELAATLWVAKVLNGFE